MRGAGTEVEVLADGFRRAGPPPDPLRWSGLRERLSSAALGQGRAVRDGLAVFHSWQNAGAVAVSLLPAGALRDTISSRRALQRSLRTLGTEPISLAALTSRHRGTPARIRGRILRARRKLLSHIWFKSESYDDNVRLSIEEGHDFFLTDMTGHGVLIVAAGGYLIGGAGAAIDAGDQVEVFGFVDHLIDGESLAGSSYPRGEPLSLAIGSGDELPVVVRKIG